MTRAIWVFPFHHILLDGVGDMIIISEKKIWINISMIFLYSYYLQSTIGTFFSLIHLSNHFGGSNSTERNYDGAML